MSVTFTGPSGTFTAVYYKRRGEWFTGVQDDSTGKRQYRASVRSSYSAAEAAIRLAEEAAGAGAKIVLP